MASFSFGIFFFLFSIILGFFILLASSFLVYQNTDDIEKISPYECGFNPFENARNQFDIQFYIVALLFIIFDVEVIFLFPWSVIFFNLGNFGFFSMIFFLFVLTLGFIYEWSKGALDWQ